MTLKKFAVSLVIAFAAVVWPRLASAANLTVGWDPPTDGFTSGYILVYGTASHSYSEQVNVGFTTSYTLINLTAGTTYYLAVRAYDASGELSEPSNEISAMPAVPVITSLSLISSISSPQLVGTTVNWSATAGGGTPPYEYQWSLYQSGAWTAWPWTSASIWAWTPTAAGSDYQVQVAVRSSGSSSIGGELSQAAPFTIASPAVSTASLASSMPSPQMVGTTILWSASASGGIGPYDYKWWLYDGSSWTATTSWSKNSSWSWTPTLANNNYVVRVWVRSAGNTADSAEASSSVAYGIKAAPKTRTCQGPKCK